MSVLTLENKTIVVTGASSGIGAACSILASNLGAQVILIGRNADRLQDTLGKMKAGDHVVVGQDITDYKLLKQNFDTVLQDRKMRVHGMIHSAGMEVTKPVRLTSAREFRDLYEINLIAGIELCKILSDRKYCSPDGASYVFVSSIMAVVGSKGLSAYCASKSAVSSAIRALALEFADKKIRVNAVQPGYVKTPLLQKRLSEMTDAEIQNLTGKHPLGLGTPADVANLCCFLLSDLAIWMTGSNIPIDGGYSIM